MGRFTARLVVNRGDVARKATVYKNEEKGKGEGRGGDQDRKGSGRRKEGGSSFEDVG